MTTIWSDASIPTPLRSPKGVLWVSGVRGVRVSVSMSVIAPVIAKAISSPNMRDTAQMIGKILYFKSMLKAQTKKITLGRDAKL